MRLGDKIGEAVNLDNIGYIHTNRGEYARALEYFTRVLEIERMTGDKDGEANCLSNLGFVQGRLGRYNEALPYFMQSLTLRKEQGSTQGVAINLLNIGYIHSILGDYNEALQCYNRTLSIMEEIGDRANQAFCLNNIGVLKAKLGYHREALMYYRRTLTIQKEIGDKRGIAFSLHNIGSIQTDLKAYTTARQFLNKAYTAARAIGEKEALRRVHISCAELNLQTENYGQAAKHAKSASLLAEDLDFRPGKAEVLLISARLQNARGKLDRSAFDKCVRAYEKVHNPYKLAVVYYHYSRALAVLDKPAAKRYLKKAEKIFSKIDARFWIDQVKDLRAKMK
jgi:tetratricopeptide (TPR) repeat protein